MEMERALSNTYHGKLDPWYQDNLIDVGNSVTSFAEDANKAAAIVIAGESGAGKSQYALRLIHRATIGSDKFSAALYLSLSSVRADPVSRSVTEDKVHDWLSRLHKCLPASEGYSAAQSEICGLRTLLNHLRNDWALRQLDDLLRRFAWKLLDYYGIKLKSLLVVVDEIGASLPMASGLIDMSRVLQARVFSGQAEQVRLVLCGTGADIVIKDSEDSFGVDPNKYDLTIMKRVDLAEFGRLLDRGEFPEEKSLVTTVEAKKAFLACLKLSNRADVLSTNVRMLRYGVIPTLLSEIIAGYFGVGEIAVVRITAHLLSMQSLAGLMDNVLRTYVQLNSLRNRTGAQREALLNAAFLYLLGKELVGAAEMAYEGEKLFPAVFDLEQSLLVEMDDTAVIRLGICTSDPQDTSPALKYFICNGLTCEYLPSTGIAFEELVALHLLRYYEALGNTVYFHTLKNQIPDVDGRESSCDVTLDFQKMKKACPTASVYVIRQPPRNNAPGPHVIVLRQQEEEWVLDMYQVENLDTDSRVEDVANCLCAGARQGQHVAALEKGMEAVVCLRYLQTSLKARDMVECSGGVSRALLECYQSNELYMVLPREAVQPTWDAGEAMLKPTSSSVRPGAGMPNVDCVNEGEMVD